LVRSEISDRSITRADLVDYVLQLADNALILGHRNSEWTGHGPILEEDIALSNISLDLIGQARNFYQYAAELINQGRTDQGELPAHLYVKGKATEDTLAYWRESAEFRNCLLAELPNGDWGRTILRVFLFSCFQYGLYAQLEKSADKTLAAIGEKSLKEVAYHLRWGSEWVMRLGDGTAESRRRMQEAVHYLWPYTGELFEPVLYEKAGVSGGIFADCAFIKSWWEQKTESVLDDATLTSPKDIWMQSGGKTGRHTEHLSYLLGEMQSVQRAYPNHNW
jgi:ring-1,2-phenylacetyl-CoA epoxidase subunit PaaC